VSALEEATTLEETTGVSPVSKPRKREKKPKASKAKGGKRRAKSPKGTTDKIRSFIRKHPHDTYKVLSGKLVDEFHPEQKGKEGKERKRLMKQMEHKIWAETSGWYDKRWKHGKGPKKPKKAKKPKGKKRKPKPKAPFLL